MASIFDNIVAPGQRANVPQVSTRSAGLSGQVIAPAFRQNPVSQQRGNVLSGQVGNLGASVPTSNPFAPRPAAQGPAQSAAPATPMIASAAPVVDQGVFGGPLAQGMYTQSEQMQSQHWQAKPLVQASQALGANIQNQGSAVANQQKAQAGAFNAAGQNFKAGAQSVAPRFDIGASVPTYGGTAAPRALSTSQLGGTPQAANVGNVNPGSLGAISNVAGQLGGGYQVGNVGGIAGQLGAAPTVGQVGNIQMQAGPGAIAGQLGNQGAFNADQAGMLQRLNGFLDAPDGPSVAEAQLQQAQSDNMANLIGAARSGRGGAGSQAQALRGAMSEGSAIMSDTAGQLATLRAQEADMLKNRQLSAIGLGGQMSEAQRAQDLGFRGQNLSALQGDQSVALGSRGQDLQAAMANQGTQTALEQLQAQTALGARGQNLSALQGDQSTALGLEGLRAQTAVNQRGQDLGALTADQQASVAARGQNLSALQGNQSTAAQMGLGNLQAQLGARGQDLSLLQGNQQTALGARGQDVSRELGIANVNMGMRGQDAGVLMADADRNLAGQRLGLDAGLGYGGLANQANATGLNFLSQANQQGLAGQGLANDLTQSLLANQTSLINTDVGGRYGVRSADAGSPDQMGFGEQLALNTIGGLAGGAGQALGKVALSDERAKESIQGLDSIKAKLDEHLRAAPAHGYRYRPGFGEDTETERAGPMAQDLERSPFGRDIVKVGADGYRRVDTGRLALVNHAALSSMRSELDALKKQLEA